MSQHSPEDDDDTDEPPLHDPQRYRATQGRRDGRGDFLWFVSSDGMRDEMLPLADIHRIEPPRGKVNGRDVVYMHFSGIMARLTGVDLARVVQRLSMRRCSALFELCPGQQRPPKGEPVIELIEFFDTSGAARRREPDGGARH
jgi:hypothetical protein